MIIPIFFLLTDKPVTLTILLSISQQLNMYQSTKNQPETAHFVAMKIQDT